MKKILLIVLTIPMIATCFAQSEPEAVNTKDMIDKIDRSDIEVDGMKIDSSMIKMTMPIIEFDETLETVKPVKSSTHNKSKDHTGHAHANKSEQEKSITEKKEVAAPIASQATKVKETVVPKQRKNSKNRKKKILVAKRPLTLYTLKNNDKIVISKGSTYIYRLSKSNIVKYKYKSKLPLDSAGLKKNSENSYYIVNKELLTKDAKSLIVEKTKKPKAQAVRRRSASKNRKSSRKPSKVVKKVVEVQDPTLTPEILSKRTKVEADYNNGKVIKKSIILRNLRVDDMIYIIGDIQLVLRKNKSTSGVKKFWLTEKINPENKSIESKGKNKFKVIRLYQEK